MIAICILILVLVRYYASDVLNGIASILFNFIFTKDVKDLQNMKEDLQKHEKELSSIFIMDEFAKHARLNRKVSKLSDDLEDKKRSFSKRKYFFSTIFLWSGKFLLLSTIVFIFISYRYTPIIELPDDTFYFLFLWKFVSFPICITGCVSCLVWAFSCEIFINVVRQFLHHLREGDKSIVR